MEFTKEELEYLLSQVVGGDNLNKNFVECVGPVSEEDTEQVKYLKRSIKDRERMLKSLLTKLTRELLKED